MDIEDLSLKLKERTVKEGFAVSGIASIPGSSRINLRTEALERWLKNDYHSEMRWMEYNERKNIELLLEGAKSVLSVGYNYYSETSADNKNLKIARFSQGQDYHKVIKKKLKNIGRWIDKEIPNCRWRICVDSSPLLEKAWAEESGLGWIGKNSTLINKTYGSWLLLGFMILDIKLNPDKPYKALCGQCEKCIEKCPTEAITEPFVINSKLCIAYHTIENRNKTIPSNIKTKLNGWIAGCDICQNVCPWNKSVPANKDEEVQPKEWMKNLTSESLNWDDDEWSDKLKGTTLKRIKPWMWRRNIKATLEN
tara:strand:- start:5978 stop:6904 length:927 start_codon:yes stop_codon:yes gene_type:complete